MTTAKNRDQRSGIRDQLKTSEMREIEVDRLILSPDETRKTIDQDALKELAASITQHGVTDPLLVRPIDLDCMSGDPLPGPAKVGDAYEIIAGQRRWLASKIAGKKTCPCIVREMSDAEAAELRTISNLQREDLPPLEEALAFKALLDVPSATVETVAAKLAKAPSYVGRRLKLLDAIEPVREALKASAIEVGHALELARLAESQQLRLLSRMNCGFNYTTPDEDEEDEDSEQVDERGVCKFCGCAEDDACRLDGGVNCSWVNAEQTVCSSPDCVAQYKAEQEESIWTPTAWSVAQLRNEIVRTTLRVLADAPFPLDDELPPMACTKCPKRSGNASLLFEDCAQDTCTDRECFDAKLKVWVKAELDATDSEKRKLVMLADGWTENRSAVSKWDVIVIPDQTPIKPCDRQEEAIYINGDRIGHRTMICRDLKCKIHASGSSGSGSRLSSREDPVKAKAERAKLLAKVNAEKKYRAALFKAVAIAPLNSLPTIDAIRINGDLNLEVCLYALGRAPGQYSKQTAEALGWPEKIFGWNGAKQLRETVLKLSPLERMRVALVAAHSGELSVNEYNSTGKPDDLEKLAKLLGLDVKKIRAGAEEKQGSGKANAGSSTPLPHPGDKDPSLGTPVRSAQNGNLKKSAPAKKPVSKPAKKKAAKKVAKKAAKR